MDNNKFSHDLVQGVLLIYRHPHATNAPTILEHVNAFEKYSKYPVVSINIEYGFPKSILTSNFSAIILHYSLFGSYPFLLNETVIKYLKDSSESYKIAFFQDEYQYCTERFEIIDDLEINCIYSLLEPQYFNEVYYKHTDVDEVFHTLTGYVDDSLIEKAENFSKPLEDRTIDVGYRGRPLPYYMGQGAQEKTQIAHKFLQHNRAIGLKCDIKTGEEDRIYGEAWHEFVANCKAMLGVEAGVSVFDIEDQVRPAVEELINKNPDISFDEVHEEVLKEWEGNIYYRTISPRIFEAAAFRVCQVLYEGKYQNILQPMVHYVPLKRDFSNIDEVLTILNDTEEVLRITDNAYQDLIASGKYHYKKIVADVDKKLKSEGFLKNINEEGIYKIKNIIRKQQNFKKYMLKANLFIHKNFVGKDILRKIYKKFKR